MKQPIIHPLEWVTGPEPSRSRIVTVCALWLVATLALYEVVVTSDSTLRLLLPSVAGTAQELVALIFGNDDGAAEYVFTQRAHTPFSEHLASTLGRVAVCLAIGSVLGYTLSIVTLAARPIVRAVVEETYELLYTKLPWTFYLIMVPVVLGFDEVAGMVTITIYVFFKHFLFVFYNAKQELYGSATTSADRQMLIERMVTSGASRWQFCWLLTIPLTLRHLFNALRESSRTAMATVPLVESSIGIGALVAEKRSSENVDGMMAVFVIFAVIMFIAWKSIRMAERRILHWEG